ncbi:hypothetical protein HY732_04715 [Candidatus Uhrbacteria bacterium]|nr:hypothetical protein [Candidatus Uhrbacteria bacterium]
MITPFGVFLPVLEDEVQRHSTPYPLGIFSLFFSAVGTFFFYRVICFFCERFFGRRLFFKKSERRDGDRLLTIISRAVFVLIGVPILLLIIAEPAVLLIPAFLLLPFAAQAGVFFEPLYGWLTAALILIFAVCYALACRDAKKKDGEDNERSHIRSLAWTSTALLFYVHFFWIFSVKIFALVFSIASYRSSPFFP